MIKEDCPKSVKIVFYVYCIVLPLAILTFIRDLMTDGGITPNQSQTVATINIIIGLFIVFGIYCKKKWTPDLIIFISIVGIFYILLHPLYLKVTIEPHIFTAVIVGTFFRIGLIGAQLYIFSRQNVRQYFKETGVTTIY